MIGDEMKTSRNRFKALPTGRDNTSEDMDDARFRGMGIECIKSMKVAASGISDGARIIGFQNAT